MRQSRKSEALWEGACKSRHMRREGQKSPENIQQEQPKQRQAVPRGKTKESGKWS